ncbi:MAG: hypothetical protein EOM50_12115 [Erysipelotrichia bacterium]|nr:hypothetical protein [Erysipelotrichia bacterium]
MKKLFEKFGKKKVYATGLVASLVVVATLIAFAMPHDNPLALKEKTFVVEYGKKISTNVKDYLETKDKDVLAKANMSVNKVENEKDKEYAKVGTYKATIKYNKKEVDFEIEVKDSKAPNFKDLMKEIVVEQNAVDVDFTKFFQAEDLSEVAITVDSKKVDLANTGTYELNVTAKDKYNNKATEKVNVKVVSLEEAEKENGVSKALDGTVYQSQALKDKIAEAEKKAQEEAEASNNASTSQNTTSNSSNAGNGGSANSGSATNGGSANGGGSNNTPANTTPYIVDDGRTYMYDETSDVALSMQSPLFDTQEDAFAWAYAQPQWTKATHGFGTTRVIFSDGSYKWSIYWYRGWQ